MLPDRCVLSCRKNTYAVFLRSDTTFALAVKFPALFAQIQNKE